MEIARALIHEPEILLLDEPTVGLDAASRQAITDYVHLLAESGLAVLWATHLIDEIRSTDQVVVLHRGKVLSDGSAEGLPGGQGLSKAFPVYDGRGPGGTGMKPWLLRLLLS